MAKQIRIEHVFKVFGDNPKAALDLVRQGHSKQDILSQTGQSIGVFDANFTIEAGEVFVIMGLSGSGKSTLVRLLNRLIEPTAGQIVVDGQDINQLNDRQLRDLRRKDISMVFQSFALMPHMTVLDNTAFGLELAGVDKAQRQRAAQDALEQVGLGAWGNSYPDELSGGMQQRVGSGSGASRVLSFDHSSVALIHGQNILYCQPKRRGWQNHFGSQFSSRLGQNWSACLDGGLGSSGQCHDGIGSGQAQSGDDGV